MDTIDTDIHDRSVSEFRIERVLDDALPEAVVTAGILAEFKSGAAEFPDPREVLFDQVIGGIKVRAHCLQQDYVILAGAVDHGTDFLLIDRHDLFAQHMFFVVQSLECLSAVREIRGCNIHRVQAGVQELIVVCIYPGNAMPGGESIPGLLLPGIDCGELCAGYLGCCCAEVIADKVCPDHSDFQCHKNVLLYG